MPGPTLPDPLPTPWQLRTVFFRGTDLYQEFVGPQIGPEIARAWCRSGSGDHSWLTVLGTRRALRCPWDGGLTEILSSRLVDDQQRLQRKRERLAAYVALLQKRAAVTIREETTGTREDDGDLLSLGWQVWVQGLEGQLLFQDIYRHPTMCRPWQQPAVPDVYQNIHLVLLPATLALLPSWTACGEIGPKPATREGFRSDIFQFRQDLDQTWLTVRKYPKKRLEHTQPGYVPLPEPGTYLVLESP